MFKFLIAIILLSTVVSYSQVTQSWVAMYNGPDNYHDYAHAIATDNSGNVYVTGESWGSGTSIDYATIKYNSSGAQQWVQRYNGPGNGTDEAFVLAVDASGNVYVTGTSRGGSSSSDYDYATVKYNSAGVQQWVTRYNGPNNSVDQPTAIAVDAFGNVYVTGYSYEEFYVFDYATVKYNSAGVQQWAKVYKCDASVLPQNHPTSLVVDAFGNVYVTGYSNKGSNSTEFDYATIKYNSNGDSLWVKRYDGLGGLDDEATAMAVDGSGNVYVTGWSYYDQNNVVYSTIKYNSTGDQQWVQYYDGGLNTSKPNALALDVSGNIYVTGWSYGIVEDYTTVKYNPAGVQQWVQRYDGGATTDYEDVAYAIAVDKYSNVYVTGSSFANATSHDFATIKYSTAGVQQWVERYSGSGFADDEAFCLTLDTSGNVYVAGRTANGSVGYDYATIKYSQPIGISPISSEIPKDFSLSQNYPNPFNPTTKFQFQIAKLSSAKLIVFDILGREVATLVNQQLKPGTYEVDFDASKLASGIYFYVLKVENFTATKKMVFNK